MANRTCLDCPTDISGRHWRTQRCTPCAEDREREAAKTRKPECPVDDGECSKTGNLYYGYCRKHRRRLDQHGTTSRQLIDPWTQYQVNDRTGCWEWTGALTREGYGQWPHPPHDGSSILAHRQFFTRHKGPIGEGLQVDHTCRVRECVNPDHLDAVTAQVNLQRMQDAILAGRCRNNLHDVLNPEDWHVPPSGKGRRCRACNVERKHRRNARERARRAASTPLATA